MNYFKQRREEIIGARRKKPRRDSAAVQSAYEAMLRAAENSEKARAACTRLMRALYGSRSA